MNTNNHIAECLNRVKAALQHGDASGVAEALGKVDLDDLLSPDTIDDVRARREHVVCIFLFTLAVDEGAFPSRAKTWLACYQSILAGTVDTRIATLPRFNVRAMSVSALAGKKPLRPEEVKKATGDDQAWQDSVELCLDFNDWPSAVSLLEAMPRRRSAGFWRSMATSLVTRQKVYRNTKLYQDSARFARLYEICIRQACAAGDSKLAKILKPLQVSALERAGRFNEAIQLIQSTRPSQRSFGENYSLSRLLCKRGDLELSLAELDVTLTSLLDGDGGERGSDAAQDPVIVKTPEEGVRSFSARSALALIDLAKLFHDAEQKIFLVSGTLLGFMREGRLMAHDKDIDVGVIGWEKQFEIFKLLRNSSLFSLSARDLHGHETHLLPVHHRPTGIAIDIFLYREQFDKLVTGVEFVFGHRQRFAFSPFALAATKFMGVDLYVPDDSGRNLEENFGNWRVPDKGYISHLESPSTLAPGGLDFMITARLHTIDALKSKNMTKLRRLLEIFGRWAHMPCAPSPALLERLDRQSRSFERGASVQRLAAAPAMMSAANA
jgi:hypothetical protein